MDSAVPCCRRGMVAAAVAAAVAAGAVEGRSRTKERV